MLLPEAQKILSDLLAPLDYDRFFDDVVGRHPLHLPAESATGRQMILGEDPKKVILDGYEKFAPTLSSHIHTPTTPPPSARPVANAGAFADLIGEYHKLGYTVRIPEATSLSPQLATLIRALEVIFEKPGDVVVFWSDSDAKAPIHFDEIDVVAIQLLGTKRWYISDQPSTLPNSWKAPGEGQPALQSYKTYDVNPGDLIYMPRGTVHTVHSTSESIHLSIGIVPVTLRDALGAALDRLSELDRPLRADVGNRADNLAQGKDYEQIFKQIRGGLDKLSQQCRSDEFLKSSLAQRRARMIQELPKLPHSRQQPQLTANTRVKHSPLAVAEMTVTPNVIDFRQPGDQILVHPGVEGAMRYIIQTPAFAISDIPGEMGDDVRIALIGRLLQSGFLEVVK